MVHFRRKNHTGLPLNGIHVPTSEHVRWDRFSRENPTVLNQATIAPARAGIFFLNTLIHLAYS
jgi:hypothetical protein